MTFRFLLAKQRINLRGKRIYDVMQLLPTSLFQKNFGRFCINPLYQNNLQPNTFNFIRLFSLSGWMFLSLKE